MSARGSERTGGAEPELGRVCDRGEREEKWGVDDDGMDRGRHGQEGAQ